MGYYPKLELKTYLAPSTVCNGVGVFSLVHIPKDTVIFKPSSMTQKVSWDQVSLEIQEKIRELCYYDKEGFTLSLCAKTFKLLDFKHFTHIDDTINTCFEAWQQNKCNRF